MPGYKPAFVFGEEPKLVLENPHATSLSEVAQAVGLAVWRKLPQQMEGSALWLNVNTFIGYTLGSAAGVARAQVIVRLGSDDGRLNPRSLARLVAEDSGTEMTTSLLSTIKGWTSFRRFQPEPPGTSEDAPSDEEYELPTNVDLFVAPWTLKTILDATTHEQGTLTIVGVLAWQLPNAVHKLWGLEHCRKRLVQQAINSAVIESESGEESGWTKSLRQSTLPRS